VRHEVVGFPPSLSLNPSPIGRGRSKNDSPSKGSSGARMIAPLPVGEGLGRGYPLFLLCVLCVSVVFSTDEITFNMNYEKICYK